MLDCAALSVGLAYCAVHLWTAPRPFDAAASSPSLLALEAAVIIIGAAALVRETSLLSSPEKAWVWLVVAPCAFSLLVRNLGWDEEAEEEGESWDKVYCAHPACLICTIIVFAALAKILSLVVHRE